jgi:IS30 family transposase
MPGQALSLSERVQIEVGVASEESARSIAGRLGREPSTITREMERNDGRHAYSAAAAHTNAGAHRLRPRATRFEQDPALAAHVEQRLRELDSPMTIAVELAHGVYPDVAEVAHEIVYRGIYAHGRAGLAKGLHSCLHRRRRCRKHRRAPGAAPTTKGPLGEFNLIGSRPDEANRRDQVGHLEGDLICGPFNRSAIATIFDRTSRFVWLADLPEGHSAPAVLAALIETLERIRQQLRRTLTWDQGSEMAGHIELADTTGVDVYFAQPHSPWQRPTNENGNGLIRRYVGKGTNLNIYKTEDLRRIETRINTMPRRSLGWSTAHAVYHQAVALTV